MASVSTPGEGGNPEVVADKLVRALSHPLRIRLLQLLEEVPASSVLLRERIGAEVSLSCLSYHVGVLYDSGCLDLVRTVPRHGSDERFYRAKPDVFLEPLYRANAGLTEPRGAMNANWSTITVDRFGWDQVVDVLRGTRMQLAAIEEQCRGRLEMMTEEGTALVVGVVALEVDSEEDRSSH
jgi:DNA-binding transcriptional ArsR family regulator